jgi:hypothetical protein
LQSFWAAQWKGICKKWFVKDHSKRLNSYILGLNITLTLWEIQTAGQREREKNESEWVRERERDKNENFFKLHFKLHFTLPLLHLCLDEKL